MNRTLQLRRGTTTKNNNFTGLPGEITFDTTAKTLRVHDGETLGGFTLARADMINQNAPNEPFDITSVPSAFWQGVFDKFMAKPLRCEISRPFFFDNSAPGMMYYHHAETPVKFATAELVCQVPQAGYAAGDIVAAFGIGDRNNPLPNIIDDPKDPNGPYLDLPIGTDSFWVSHKDTGRKTIITYDNWKIRYKIWL